MKGEAAVIPMAVRPSIKRRLHSAHLGRDSMLRRARGTVYWPNIAGNIKHIADMCEICHEMKPRNLFFSFFNFNLIKQLPTYILTLTVT